MENQLVGIKQKKKFFFFEDLFNYLDEVVKSETSGDLQKGILAIIRCIKSRPHFFAEQLRNAIKVGQSYFLLIN